MVGGSPCTRRGNGRKRDEGEGGDGGGTTEDSRNVVGKRKRRARMRKKRRRTRGPTAGKHPESHLEVPAAFFPTAIEDSDC